jgi:hypothetical protein
MKKLNIFLFIILGCFIIQVTHSQNIGDLKGIYYQAVAIDEHGKEIVGMDVEGKPLYDKAIGVRFTITKGANGPVQWEETHTATTDKYGLFSLTIGLGQQSGNGAYNRLLDIPWIDADQFLKVEIATKNDGNYKLVSNQQFMAMPYSFYTDDIADDAITTEKILNRTILAEDISEGAVTTFEILDGTILNEDISDEAVTTEKIMNRTILAEDISEGAVTTFEILDGTIQNEDIADETIDLTTKVTGILPVANGGMGISEVNQGNILIGSDSGTLDTLAVNDNFMALSNANGVTELFKVRAGARTFINVDPDTKTIYISAVDQSGGPGTGEGQVSVGNIASGSQQVRNFPSAGVQPGDIILATTLQDLRGITLTSYVRQEGQVNVIFFNGTNQVVDLGVVDVRFANFGQP